MFKFLCLDFKNWFLHTYTIIIAGHMNCTIRTQCRVAPGGGLAGCHLQNHNQTADDEISSRIHIYFPLMKAQIQMRILTSFKAIFIMKFLICRCLFSVFCLPTSIPNPNPISIPLPIPISIPISPSDGKKKTEPKPQLLETGQATFYESFPFSGRPLSLSRNLQFNFSVSVLFSPKRALTSPHAPQGQGF